VVGYLPIAINFDASLVGALGGPTAIVYNSAGGEPSYYNSPYKLYRQITNEILDNVIWSRQALNQYTGIHSTYP
jgi:hypothetical protein